MCKANSNCIKDGYYIDDGYSGTNFNRPDWIRLTGLIDEGRVATIIVKDMSRLGRDYLQVGMYTEIVFQMLTSDSLQLITVSILPIR